MGKSLNIDVTPERTPDDEDWSEFTINGDTEHPFFYLAPTEDQLTLYTAIFAKSMSTADMVQGTLEFLESIMAEDSFDQYEDRLKDRQDPYVTMDSTMKIIELLFKETTSFPTRPSSVSTSSQRNTGRPLTDHLPPRTSRRVRSPQTVSATSSTSGSSND